MSVLLGPNAGLMQTGTPTGPHSIPGIMHQFQLRDQGQWVAAHLLNAQLGGRGDYAANLVPMTQTANKNHSALELCVKNLCTVARQQMSQGNGGGYCYAVRYEVTASPIAFGPFAPYHMAPSHMTVAVQIEKKPWDPVAGFSYAHLWTPIDALDPLWHHFLPYLFHPTEVHNDDSHLA